MQKAALNFYVYEVQSRDPLSRDTISLLQNTRDENCSVRLMALVSAGKGTQHKFTAFGLAFRELRFPNPDFTHCRYPLNIPASLDWEKQLGSENMDWHIGEDELIKRDWHEGMDDYYLVVAEAKRVEKDDLYEGEAEGIKV